MKLIATTSTKSYNNTYLILRGIALVTLVSLISSCSLKIPYLNSTEKTEKSTSAASQSESNTSPANQKKQAAPNSALMKRQFENKIADKVIDNYLMSRTDQRHARSEFLTRDALQQNAVHLTIANEQLQRLDQKLLREKNRNRTRQLAALQASRQRVASHWAELNHLNELDALWPKLIFEPLSERDLAAEEDYLLSTKSKLVDLQLRITAQYAAGQLYPELLLTDSKSRLKAVVRSTSRSPNKDNPYLLRFQQQLLYASITDQQKQQRFEAFTGRFHKLIQPAFKAFLSFLESLDSQSNIEKPLLLTGTFGAVDASLNRERVNQLKLSLADIDKSIVELAPNINIKTLYADPAYLLADKPKPKQMALNLLTLYVADIEFELTTWFYRRPSDEVLLVAADQLSSDMIHYENGQVAFDLETMTALPDFEYESLAYQFVVPGAHMLAPWTDLHTGQSPMADAFTLAWNQYSQTLPIANPSFYVEDLSRIGHRVRYKRFLTKALVDLQLHTGQWSVEEAELFMSSQLPYREAFIEAEIISILKHPGKNFEAWQLAESIEATVTEVIVTGQLSLKETHQTLLRNSPMDHKTLMLVRQSLLKRSQKSSTQ